MSNKSNSIIKTNRNLNLSLLNINSAVREGAAEHLSCTVFRRRFFLCQKDSKRFLPSAFQYDRFSLSSRWNWNKLLLILRFINNLLHLFVYNTFFCR